VSETSDYVLVQRVMCGQFVQVLLFVCQSKHSFGITASLTGLFCT
jgi:hypothetical protein